MRNVHDLKYRIRLTNAAASTKTFWRRCAFTETPGPLHPVNSITLGTETLVAMDLAWDGPLLVPELCSAIFGLEAGALGRGKRRWLGW